MRIARMFVALGLTITPRLVQAQASSWHATVNGETAVTDNVFAAPNDGERDGDLFFQLRPGLLYTRGSPRLIHDLSAEADIIHYAFNSRVPSLTGRGAWRMFALLGPRTEMITSVGGGTGVLTALSSRLSPDESTLNLQPAGRVTLRQADASQYLSHVLTPAWRFSENLFGRFDESNDNADDRDGADGLPLESTILSSAEAGVSFGLERNFRRHALSLETGASVQRFERQAPDDAIQGDRLDRQVVPRIRGQWRYDVSRRQSVSVDGGLVFIRPFGTDPYNPDEKRQNGMFPVVGGRYSWTYGWGRAAIQARRDVTPSNFIAENTVNDSATLSAAVPLVWLDNSSRRQPKYAALGLLSAQRTRLVDSLTSDTRSSFLAARVDLGIVYTPRPGLSYGLRYELILQTSDENAEMAIAGFYRNTLYATLQVRYPEKVVARVPKRRAGNAVRADKKDLVPFGAEPVIPDPTDSGDTSDPEEDR